jgi:hypothetical protein
MEHAATTCKSLSMGACFLASLALVGCSADFSQTVSAAADGVRIAGSLHGGNSVVTGSKIYLYAAGTGGYGSSARSMLIGSGYVVTGSVGDYTITSQYTCQPGDQVYLLALGGNPGLAAGTNNPALAEMAALGACSSLSPSTHIVVSEVTTVAAAYALSGFMTSTTSLASSGTALAQTGVANAFLNAANLADYNTGNGRTTTVAGGGVVPLSELNSIANSIASCVNSDGTGLACTTLFTATTPTNGIAPTDTIQALLNIAHNPGSNVGTLFNISTAIAPFQPTLGAAPHDWSVTVTYPNPFSFHGTAAPFSGIAIDGLGNIWVPNQSTITVLAASGAALSPTGGYPAGLGNSEFVNGNLAIDSSNVAWFGAVTSTNTAFSNPRIVKLNNAGTTLGSYTGGGVGTYDVEGLGFDATGNLWTIGTKLSNSLTAFAVSKFTSAGTALSPATGYSLGTVNSIAPTILADTAGHIWGASKEFSSTGSIINTATDCSSDYFFTVSIDRAGNLWAPYKMCSASGTTVASYSSGLSGSDTGTAVDGDNRIWILDNAGPLAVVNSTGQALSPSGGYQGPSKLPVYMAIDGSGNIWLANEYQYITEYIGIASPVVTPLATAVASGKLGTRP